MLVFEQVLQLQVAQGAGGLHGDPAVDALRVKEMQAWQATALLAHEDVISADGAGLLGLLVGREHGDLCEEARRGSCGHRGGLGAARREGGVGQEVGDDREVVQRLHGVGRAQSSRDKPGQHHSPVLELSHQGCAAKAVKTTPELHSLTP